MTHSDLELRTDETEDKATPRERPLLLPCFYFVELPLFGIVTVFAYILHFTNVFVVINGNLDPFDASISKYYIPENNRSLSSISFFLIATAGPPAIIIVVECIVFVSDICCRSRPSNTIGSTGCYINAALRRIVRFIGIYMFGLLATSIICDITQKHSPLVSPHFLSVCKFQQVLQMVPAENFYTVSGPDVPSRERSVRGDKCLPVLGLKEVKAARLEFPSYYVSMVSYTSTYVFLYFRLIMVNARPVLKSLVTWSTIFLPYVVGLAEMAENISHGYSVVAGWILGVLTAGFIGNEIFSLRYAIKCRKSRKRAFQEIPDKHKNIFDPQRVPAFSLHNYDVGQEDNGSAVSNRNEDEYENIHRQTTKLGSEVTGSITQSPAASRFSHSTQDHFENEVIVHRPDRNVIKELQSYITDTDFRGRGVLESPRPTQIRYLSKTGAKGPVRNSMLSTFQTPLPSQAENDDGRYLQDIPPDLHAPGCKTDYADDHNNIPENSPSSHTSSCKSAMNFGEIGITTGLNLPDLEDGHSSFPRITRLDYAGQRNPDDQRRPVTINVDDFQLFNEYALKGYGHCQFSSAPTTSSDSLSDKKSQKSNPDDIVQETSNLLREVINVMNRGEEEKSSDGEDHDSDETIIGDQPSIAV